jgi:hypothetical protein
LAAPIELEKSLGSCNGRSLKVLAAVAFLFATSAHALDLDSMWDFRQPTVSEERFRAALKSGADQVFEMNRVQSLATMLLPS